MILKEQIKKEKMQNTYLVSQIYILMPMIWLKVKGGMIFLVLV